MPLPHSWPTLSVVAEKHRGEREEFNLQVPFLMMRNKLRKKKYSPGLLATAQLSKPHHTIDDANFIYV
jgi:hypothetical protein